jgi:hypothetical protein
MLSLQFLWARQQHVHRIGQQHNWL